MNRKVTAAAALIVVLLVGLSGCELLEMFGISVSGTYVDLRVQSVDFSGTDSVVVKIANDGEDTQSNVKFILVFSDTLSATLADYEVYEDYVSVGGLMTVTEQISLADLNIGSVPDGEYYIGVIVDPDNSVAEDNENNNSDSTATTYLVGGGGGGTGGGAPATPTGFGITETTPFAISLAWDTVTDATGYEVYRDTSSGGSFTSLVYDGTGTSVTDYVAVTGQTYYYVVYAYNSSGISASSSVVPASTNTVMQFTDFDYYDDYSFLFSGDTVWISIDVTSGYLYALAWNDSYEGDDTQTADVEVSVYESDAETPYADYYDGTVLEAVDSGYDGSGGAGPWSIQAAEDGKVYVKVTEYYGSTGTFQFKVFLPTFTLTGFTGSDFWNEMELAEYNVHWFELATVAGTTYTVSWLDSYDGDPLDPKTADVVVSAYNASDWTVYFSQVDNGYTSLESTRQFTAVGTTTYIMVEDYNVVNGVAPVRGTYSLNVDP